MRISLKSILSEYTTVNALVLLCGLLSIVTWGQQFPAGAIGGRQVAKMMADRGEAGQRVLIVVRPTEEDAEFAGALEADLLQKGMRIVETVNGQPADVRRAVTRAAEAGEQIDWIAGSEGTATWTLFDNVA